MHRETVTHKQPLWRFSNGCSCDVVTSAHAGIDRRQTPREKYAQQMIHAPLSGANRRRQASGPHSTEGNAHSSSKHSSPSAGLANMSPAETPADSRACSAAATWSPAATEFRHLRYRTASLS